MVTDLDAMTKSGLAEIGMLAAKEDFDKDEPVIAIGMQPWDDVPCFTQLAKSESRTDHFLQYVPDAVMHARMSAWGSGAGCSDSRAREQLEGCL